MFNVDFESQEPQVICHDQYKSLIPKILSALKSYAIEDHFILFSSGTTGGDLKGYAVSKKALFANASAVNDHFSLTTEDVWALSLPVYHIGGLSVVARAHLLKNKIIDARHWEPVSWLEKIQDATITTIVPTQLYDLVKRKLSPSKNLRYIVVGGDLLSPALKSEALKLGWPVIRTFGMSEVCSQLASAKTPESDTLEMMPIHQVRIEDEKLLVKSQALFTLEFTIGEKINVTPSSELCTQDGFYITKDRASFENNVFRHLGRVGDEIKVSGHLVNLIQLRDQLSGYLVRNDLFNQMEFSFEKDERKGNKIILLTLKSLDQSALAEISSLIYPVKIDEVKVVESFARTALGKLKASSHK
jgi:O-succinylbenzoic acid--CoA ligase